MSDLALVAELRAASVSMIAATKAAEHGDWATAERAVLDAQERSARLLRELGRKLLKDFEIKEPPGPGKSA